MSHKSAFWKANSSIHNAVENMTKASLHCVGGLAFEKAMTRVIADLECALIEAIKAKAGF